ncbi:unnamed protein product [Calypogeia fissa]
MTDVTKSHKLCLSSWKLRFVVLTTLLMSSVHGDPTTLIKNGGFETESFSNFGGWPQFDVIHDGDMNFIENWQCVHGGVQLLDAGEYVPDPAYPQSLFLVHLNYKYGPGVLITSPAATPRKGATYNLTFSYADNPDGGPVDKTLRVKVLVNGYVAEPVIEDFVVSSPESQRDTIPWSTGSSLFVGSGETTTFQFESLVVGSFGPLTTLMSVVDNGSFEDTDEIMVITNDTWYNVIVGPSTVITGWTVVSGMIKTASGQWEKSTDQSAFCLDLNANETAGRIVSDPFPTVPGYQYVLLYDAVANPDGTMPVSGNMLVSAKTSVDGQILNSQLAAVDADGYSVFSIGWTTNALSFTAPGYTAVVEFVSKISGSLGPLLDNVNVYQVVPTKKFKSLPITYNAAEKPSRPSIWMVTLLTAIELYVSLQERTSSDEDQTQGRPLEYEGRGQTGDQLQSLRSNAFMNLRSQDRSIACSIHFVKPSAEIISESKSGSIYLEVECRDP